MSNHSSRLTSEEVQNLADFVLFSQRSCILKLSPVLTKGKVSYPQFFLLAYLAEEECLSMSNIAKMMGHSTAAATGMVDKLQDLGHLKRYTAASFISLSAEGSAAVSETLEAVFLSASLVSFCLALWAAPLSRAFFL